MSRYKVEAQVSDVKVINSYVNNKWLLVGAEFILPICGRRAEFILPICGRLAE